MTTATATADSPTNMVRALRALADLVSTTRYSGRAENAKDEQHATQMTTEQPKPARLLASFAFRKELEQSVAHAVCETVNRYLPCHIEGLDYVLKMHGINYRYNVTRCGQDLQPGRVNVTTDGNETVTEIHCG